VTNISSELFILVDVIVEQDAVRSDWSLPSQPHWKRLHVRRYWCRHVLWTCPRASLFTYLFK